MILISRSFNHVHVSNWRVNSHGHRSYARVLYPRSADPIGGGFSTSNRQRPPTGSSERFCCRSSSGAAIRPMRGLGQGVVSECSYSTISQPSPDLRNNGVNSTVSQIFHLRKAHPTKYIGTELSMRIMYGNLCTKNWK